MSEPRSVVPPAERPTNAGNIGLPIVGLPARLLGGTAITVVRQGLSATISLDVGKLQPQGGLDPAQTWVPAWLEDGRHVRVPVNAIPQDAPIDGALYGRKDGAWADLATELTVTWENVGGKPTTFPPTLPIAQSGIDGLPGTLVDLQNNIDAVALTVPVKATNADPDTDNAKFSTPADVIARAERGDFTPQSPFIATRTLGEKVGEIISIRDLGVPTMSGGQPDYTSVLVNQEANLAYKTIEINEPIIRLTGLALTVNNICLKGKGWTQTVIYNPDNTDTLTLSDCSFPEVVSLSLQHAPGAASGRGLVCTGSTSSGRFMDLFVANNPSGGIHCLGSSGVQQSANRVEGCLFTDNGEEQLFLDWCNDTRVLNNDFGRFAFAGYPKRGVKFSNSGQGTYSGNKHWNNIIAAEFVDCNGMRIAVNRFEESRNEGVIISGGYDNTFLGNHVHTNSQSATGAYSAIRMASAGRVSLIANKTYSWDAATYKHKHGIEADSSCAIDELLGNDCADNVSAAINTNSAFVVSRAMNSGDDVILRANGLGASASEVYLDLNNPNVSDYASQRVLQRVAGAPRVAFNSQRYGSGAGGQFILEVADAAGVLQNRIIVDQFGQIFLPGLPTSPGSPGSLWKDGSGFVKVA